jgi:hypothetical protein
MMRRTSSLLLLLLLFFGGTMAQAQKISDAALHVLIERGIEAAGAQRYAEARTLFDEAIRRWPAHPAGPLNKAILLQVMSLDFETPVPQPEYTSLLERAITLGEKMLEQNARSVEASFAVGMAHSYIAYDRFRDGENWIGGLAAGLKAQSYFDDCLKFDASAWDAMTGVGTYKYWKSRQMSFLTWTPLVDDERGAGIALLRKAESHGAYTAAQATNSLIWIYIEEERWSDAIRAAQRMLKRYPTNRLFLWGLASAAEKKGDLRLARDAYQRIVQSIDSEVRERRYIEIQARAKIARHSFSLGDRETAQRECERVLALGGRIDRSVFTGDGASRIRKRVDDMVDLHEELGLRGEAPAASKK